MKCLHRLVNTLALSEVAVGLVVWMMEGHDELRFISGIGFLLFALDESFEFFGIFLDGVSTNKHPEDLEFADTPATWDRS
jgi:hypothetical protein